MRTKADFVANKQGEETEFLRRVRRATRRGGKTWFLWNR